MKAFAITLFSLIAFTALSQRSSLVGAWERKSDQISMVKIYSDQFFSISVYNIADKQFISTAGGRWQVEGGTIKETYEFNTSHPDFVGQTIVSPIEQQNEMHTLTINNQKEQWKRLDDGNPGKLSGAWLITQRIMNEVPESITPGARKTMKSLSGTRFQWIAYNSDTKEFFGTGGGTYTTDNGKYTENIEFFSRDNSRVGASLTFDYSLENGNWRHKGLSSKGDPINEVWTKREKLGL
jgi:hypothetical protein